MVFALSADAENELLEGFKKRTFDKKYIALVYGRLDKSEGIISGYLVKDSKKATVTVKDEKVKGGVQIKTGYKVLFSFDDNSSVLFVTLYTGKTHQIRAHLSHIGHFIIGDGKYGINKINEYYRANYGIKNQMLYSYSITLRFTENSKLYYLNGKTFCLNNGQLDLLQNYVKKGK